MGDAIGIVGTESGCVKAVGAIGAIVGCVMVGVSCGGAGCANCCTEAFLRPCGPQRRQSLALKSIRPGGRCRRKQRSQRIHLVDPITDKQAGGTSVNAVVQLSFVMESTCTSSLRALALMSAAYAALSREEITEQGRRGSLRIQRQKHFTETLSPTCLASSMCETVSSASSKSG